MIEYPDFPHAYDNPSSMSSLVRSGNRVTSSYGHHRRTSSNVSNTSTSSQSNINPTFQLEDESEYLPYSPTNYYHHQRLSSNIGYSSSSSHDYNNSSSQYLTRQNSHDSNPNTSDNGSSRPSNLEVVGRLRSSLKKSNYSYNSSNKNNSGSGTPTNPTPPDSLTSEDSSYVSAKDSQISMSRVRFSPVTFDRGDVQQREQHRDGIIDQTGQDVITSPLQSSRRTSRNRKPSISDLEREFLS